MKVSLNWIKDFVEIPEDIAISQIAYDLTMSTVEVEDTTDLTKEFANIVVGVIKEILPHPNADKLKICKTDIGNSIQEIVCGGSNLKPEMKVAVACPGALVRWHGAGEPVEIKIAKLRGVQSYGMICASSEIGLFDLFPFTEESTIIDLSEFNAPAGTGLAIALGLDDVVLEIDNKSLTNRPDLWGHFGIAREIATLYDLPLKEFVSFTPPSTPNFEVIIDDISRCRRYIGVKIEVLFVKPSPFEIQSRIWRVGMRPINAIVDITNYVMLTTGQPTHAFDSDCIEGHITVRRAHNSEKLLLLNGQELSLSSEDLVIADEASPVGLAGVMGGEKDSILPTTNTAILEIANFEAIGIRKTSTRYDLRTEAGARNDKGIDPERCDQALSLAMQMFAEIFPKMHVTGYRDVYPEPLQKSEVDVSLDWLEKRLGKRIPNPEIASKLEHMGFKLSFQGDNLHVVAPTWRSTGDISIPNDIIEEVARMYGFENFEPKPIAALFDSAINQLEIDVDRKIREYLAFRCGMNEIFSYPWVSDEYASAILSNFAGMLSLSTPPSPEKRFIRSSLLPNLCMTVANNLRFYSEFSIFESAQIFFDRNFETPYDARESLPLQRRAVAGAFVGAAEELNSLFRRTKGVLEALPKFVHIEPLQFEKTEKPTWADEVLWLNINHGGKQVGNLALLSKKAALDCGIKNSAVMLFELDMDSLKPYPSRTNQFERLPEYPMTEYDVSMLFDLSVQWEEIFKTITGKISQDDLLRDVSFVDEYRGPQIPSNMKSITFRLVVGSLKKTLTSEEIESCAQTIVKRLSKKLGAELRS